MVHAMDALSGS